MGREDLLREDIPSEDLSVLRGILVSSLSRENLGPLDPPAPPPRRRRRKVTFLEGHDSNSPGATPVDPKQNGRPSTAKQGLHWFAECGVPPDLSDSPRKSPQASHGPHWLSEDLENELSSEEGKEGQSHVDREERLRILREKQNEERQRKLEELKQQAMAAQKFREQKEEERRRRLEELRVRDTDRRHQVEERKRQIWEAERDRREAILRKNQEREARIESKRKNERSSIVFAFGSSTPRMLEPGDTGSSYWATRRATSTSNVMTLSLSAAPGPLTRRSSERELEGSKKRATSAGGIERKPQDRLQMSSSIYEVFQWGVPPSDSPTPNLPFTPFVKMETEVRRKKTDLTPTVPERDTTPPPRKGKPGRAYSMSRLDVLSQPRGALKPLAPTQPLRRGTARSMVSLGPPRPTRAERLRRKAREQQARSQSLEQPASPGARSGEITPSRPQSSLSQHSVSSQLSAASLRARTPRRPRPVSIAVTGISSPGSDRSVKSPSVTATEKPPIPKVHSAKKSTPSKNETTPKKPSEKPKSSKSSASTTPKATPLQSPQVETASTALSDVEEKKDSELPPDIKEDREVSSSPEPPAIPSEKSTPPREASPPAQPSPPPSMPNPPAQQPEPQPQVQQVIENGADLAEADMTASMIAKIRITTEVEAKAALAERRRLAREQAEREAELERQRLEAERLAEEERLRKEEEEQKRMEEEQLRLLEEARRAEEIRLQQAIEEAQRREEEERKRKEEEIKQKLEKEEADKKAKEEAEKMRIEMEIRLKKEEEDRQARRKRVEAIMLRTRGRGSTASATTPSKDGEESEENSPPEEAKKSNVHDQFLNSERSHSDANTINAIPPLLENNNKHNGHHNGSIDTVSENNVTNSLLDLSTPGEILELPTGNGKLPETPPFIENNQSHPVNDLLS